MLNILKTMYEMYKMSETKSDTLGFMKSNQTYIRIAIEIIAVLVICYYFTSKNSSVLKHVENVSQRLEELEDSTTEKIEKLTEMNNQLTNELTAIKQQLQSNTQFQTESRKRKMETAEVANPFSVQPPQQPFQHQQRQPFQQGQPFQQRRLHVQPPQQSTQQPPQQSTQQPPQQPPQQSTQLSEIITDKVPDDKQQVAVNDDDSDQVKTVSEYNSNVDEEDLDVALKKELAELDD